MCLEWSTHCVLSGSWSLWHRAVMYFASHLIALIELCGPLPYMQGSGAFGSLWSHGLYLELSLLVLWWLIILLNYLKSNDGQIYSTNYNTWYKRAMVTRMCVHKEREKRILFLRTFSPPIKWSNETYSLQWVHFHRKKRSYEESTGVHTKLQRVGYHLYLKKKHILRK